MAKAVLINPNNGAIDTRYDPNDIDAPHSYRARDGFMGIGPLWANNDDGTVYMQGHVVIPNPWGDAVTHGTTTTTTDDTTDKDGGDDEDDECGESKDCLELRDKAIRAHTRYVAWTKAYRKTKETQSLYKPRFYTDPTWPGGLGYELESRWTDTTELMRKIAEEEGIDFEENFDYLRSKAIERQLKEIDKEIVKAASEYTALCSELIANGCGAPLFCFEPSIV
jgi:hypothetical protein